MNNNTYTLYCRVVGEHFFFRLIKYRKIYHFLSNLLKWEGVRHEIRKKFLCIKTGNPISHCYYILLSYTKRKTEYVQTSLRTIS